MLSCANIVGDMFLVFEQKHFECHLTLKHTSLKQISICNGILGSCKVRVAKSTVRMNFDIDVECGRANKGQGVVSGP